MPDPLPTTSDRSNRRRPQDCDTYWGSHGCHLNYGHDGPCVCCCECENHPDPGSGCVGAAPYYGPDTSFYGDDIPTQTREAANA